MYVPECTYTCMHGYLCVCGWTDGWMQGYFVCFFRCACAKVVIAAPDGGLVVVANVLVVAALHPQHPVSHSW